ncbi:hypothetical protein [Ochrobactrum sp. MYb379]|uniref:hypothetical protein n=1 Tax=Ochrobactrum sp. MYb379 TaxID=2745275 RepID=UPI0030988722
MARPKLGETDTERMQLKITSAEIAAIDDWRFGNRVPSRSEAVRRLVQIGLFAAENSEKEMKLRSKYRQDLGELFLSLLEFVWEHENNTDTLDEYSEKILESIKSFNKLSLEHTKTYAFKKMLSEPKYNHVDIDKLSAKAKEILNNDNFKDDVIQNTYEKLKEEREGSTNDDA